MVIKLLLPRNSIPTDTSIKELFQLIAYSRQTFQLKLRKHPGVGVRGEVAAVRDAGGRDVVDVTAPNQSEPPAAGLLLETEE